MTAYAQAARCRWHAILDYFGEAPEWGRCQHCDNCAHAPAAAPEPIAVNPVREEKRGLQPGDAVEVPRYGEGRVRGASGERVQVEFPDGVTRHFLSEYVRPVR